MSLRGASLNLHPLRPRRRETYGNDQGLLCAGSGPTAFSVLFCYSRTTSVPPLSTQLIGKLSSGEDTSCSPTARGAEPPPPSDTQARPCPCGARTVRAVILGLAPHVRGPHSPRGELRIGGEGTSSNATGSPGSQPRSREGRQGWVCRIQNPPSH